MEDLVDTEVTEESKTCPMCGKSLRLAARLCRFCGEPQYDMAGGDGAWCDGTLLVMRKNAALPYRCIKSNAPANGWLARTTYWHHPAVYLLVFLGPVYLFIAPFFQHEAKFQIALSQQWFNRRFSWIMASCLLALGGVAMFFAGYFGISVSKEQVVEAWLMGLSPFPILAAIIMGMSLSQLVTPAKISRDHVWLRGVHRDYLATLPQWPGEP